MTKRDEIIAFLNEQGVVHRSLIAEHMGLNPKQLSVYMTQLKQQNRVTNPKLGFWGPIKETPKKVAPKPETRSEIIARGDLFEYVGKTPRGTRIVRSQESGFMYELRDLEV